MQNLMDGQHQHQPAMLHQQQLFQNHGQHQQVATSESHARGQRQHVFTMESMSGSYNMEGGGGSGSVGEELQEEGLALRRPRKKRYQRHTLHQIQELESYVYFSSTMDHISCMFIMYQIHDDDGFILYFVLHA
jgi:homeobox-leucine zipper protein